MLWRRSRIVWTDPLPPPSQYVNVLGTKLKMLLRAPSGVNGSSVAALSWTDEISGAVIPRTVGTPTLVQDSSNFSGRPVVRMASAPHRFDQAFANPILPVGTVGCEIFAVFRAVSVPNVDGLLCGVFGAAPGFAQLGLSSKLNTLAVTYGNGGFLNSTPFTDVVNVHFASVRLQIADPSLNTARAVINLDGVDVLVAGGTVSPVVIDGTRIIVGSGTTAFDGFVGLCGVVLGTMSTAERAEILRIARAEFGF